MIRIAQLILLRRRRVFVLFSAVMTAVAISACGGSSTSGSGPLTIAVFNPFSGPDASFGPEEFAGCPAAAQAIVAAGGILSHHQLKCKSADSRGDPADAVPAATQLVATTSGLVGIIGPSSDEASATVPIFNRARIPMLSDTGQTQFNHTSFEYFWRITPPDNAVGLAMAKYARDAGYRSAGSVFGNDISSQGAAPAIVSTYPKLGGQLTAHDSVALDQSSYRTEIEHLAAAHPQAVFIEADPQTSATYLTELKQLYHLVPIIGTDGTVQPPWLHAVSRALGAAAFNSHYVGAEPYTPVSGPAHAAWLSQLNAAASSVQHPVSQWDNDPYAESVWDSVNIMALAMQLAGSTDPSVYNRYIPRVVNGGSGAVVVHDFGAGKAAILHHKAITYVGATGPIALDRYHNSPGGFQIVRANGNPIKIYTAGQIVALGG